MQENNIMQNLFGSFTQSQPQFTQPPQVTPQTDPLTGCLHASLFAADFKDLADFVDKSSDDLTIVMLDLDNFMRVNENHGHETGDKVLRETAQALLEIEKDHKTYRYSGDSFALLFPKCEKESAFLIMEETRKKIAAMPECARVGQTISAGVATYPEDGTRESDILRKADGALYRAKTAGRNKVALAKEDKLVTKTAHYTVEQLKKLEALAEAKKVSEAVLMREALDELLRKYNE